MVLSGTFIWNHWMTETSFYLSHWQNNIHHPDQTEISPGYRSYTIYPSDWFRRVWVLYRKKPLLVLILVCYATFIYNINFISKWKKKYTHCRHINSNLIQTWNIEGHNYVIIYEQKKKYVLMFHRIFFFSNCLIYFILSFSFSFFEMNHITLERMLHT